MSTSLAKPQRWLSASPAVSSDKTPLSLRSNYSYFPGFTKANQAANYHFWLSDLDGTIQETGSNREEGPKLGCRSYKFQDVKFAYPLAPDNQVLDGVSLSVSTGVLERGCILLKGVDGFGIDNTG